jgi:hypothetical protein
MELNGKGKGPIPISKSLCDVPDQGMMLEAPTARSRGKYDSEGRVVDAALDRRVQLRSRQLEKETPDPRRRDIEDPRRGQVGGGREQGAVWRWRPESPGDPESSGLRDVGHLRGDRRNAGYEIVGARTRRRESSADHRAGKADRCLSRTRRGKADPAHERGCRLGEPENKTRPGRNAAGRLRFDDRW